ncbi:MAG TPA: ester cyclase [Chloroflexota bacterium]|nr:ester cyclase [Chloroflexota bacterium]
MEREQNKEIIRHWFEEIVNGKIDRATLLAEMDTVIAPSFVDHDGPDPVHGRAALERALSALLTALPDARLKVEQLIGEGDLVAVRVRGEATHTGEAMGIPPTGKRIAWTENEIFRLDNGRIVESWGEGSLDEALGQIGFAFRAKQPTAG